MHSGGRDRVYNTYKQVNIIYGTLKGSVCHREKESGSSLGTQGRQVAVLNRLVREGPTEEVTFEQDLKLLRE